MKRFALDDLSKKIQWQELEPHALTQLAQWAYEEDLSGYGIINKPHQPIDVTTEALGLKGTGKASIVARESLIVSGTLWIDYFIKAYDAAITFDSHTHEGQTITKGGSIGTLKGDITDLLKIERPLLNALQYLSGIATEAHEYKSLLGTTPTRLLDTRKTLPGWRYLQKYAVACGGLYNHRLGLFDRILIKDNHLAALNIRDPHALTDLLLNIKKNHPNTILEVEIDHLEQLPPLLAADIDIVLCDNFSDQSLKQAIEIVNNQIYIEASGGISGIRIPCIANIGLDFISMGALTQHARSVDIALDWL